ncbi:hypothetical protein ACIRU8_45860, partial [Streptomyces sp. NPDC101175]|uniref:hypothetical protein n=1 Tax=Streptomyces sp. NPDC101175 TaxID=3366123 RepID=UPI0038350C54
MLSAHPCLEDRSCSPPPAPPAPPAAPRPPLPAPPCPAARYLDRPVTTEGGDGDLVDVDLSDDDGFP